MGKGINISVGDTVSWSSQSQGCETTKTGTVVAVIPPDCAIAEAAGFPWGLRHNTFAYGWRRSHTSYAVNVNGKLYWPRTRRLSLRPSTPTISP